MYLHGLWCGRGEGGNYVQILGVFILCLVLLFYLEVRTYPSFVTASPSDHDRNRDGAAAVLLPDSDFTTERVYLVRLGKYAARGADMQHPITILFPWQLLKSPIGLVISDAHLGVRVIRNSFKKSPLFNTDGDSLFFGRFDA